MTTAILLGAGYATRLYPLTRDKPKPLLPVGGVSILQRIVERIKALPVQKIFVVSNHRFIHHYQSWLRNYAYPQPPPTPIEIVDDRTTSNDDRLGAIGDVQFVVDQAKLKDDLLVVAGDNLLEFDLAPFLEFAREKGAAVGLKDFKRNEKLVSQYGAVQLDKAGKVIDFEEKPPMPRTTLISIGLYYLAVRHLELIKRYLAQKQNPDAPGYFIQWLYKQIDLYGYPIGGEWLDIGDIDSYNAANQMFGVQ